VIYTLSYQNTGNIALTGITLNEQVPANTTFRTTGSTAGWSCANGAAAGSVPAAARGEHEPFTPRRRAEEMVHRPFPLHGRPGEL